MDGGAVVVILASFPLIPDPEKSNCPDPDDSSKSIM